MNIKKLIKNIITHSYHIWHPYLEIMYLIIYENSYAIMIRLLFLCIFMASSNKSPFFQICNQENLVIL